MAVARAGEQLVLHAARTGRFASALRDGPVCVNVTLLDGVVLSRSAFHHSLNYRSVTVFGRAREVTDPGEQTALAEALVEQVMPGRSREVRAPDAIEWKATAVFVLALEECSAKARVGGPKEDEADLGLPVWAGHIPLRMVAGEPVPHESAVESAVPESVRGWRPSRGRK
jgi:nitroimidazol reductase NimA-like FMN-containing flavoprotein (pyridoxamine 5'-phosphate oxidase superfamily)